MEQRLSEVGRRDYVTLVASMIVAGGQVGAKGLTKLYEAFSLLDTPESDRLNLVEMLVFGHEKLKNLPIPAEIMSDDEVRLALAKDAVIVGQLRQDTVTKLAVANLLNQIKLSPEQSRVMADWGSLENKILQRLGAGEEWMASASDAKEIVARAAAVGIPLSALYAAGITGFSAVGITSGLAAIGGYSGLTILGLNPMTAGIAGLIIAGVTVKKVADFAIGNSNVTAEAKAFREQIELIRSVQMKAATRLAGDIPRYAASGHIWHFWRRHRRKKMVEVMGNALLLLENVASSPQKSDT